MGNYFQEGGVPKVAQHKYIDKNSSKWYIEGLSMKLDVLAEKMKELGMEQHYIDKVRKWETSLFAATVRATDPDYYPGDFHTVLHGDLWLNNQMFKYNDQKELQDVKFVRRIF